MAPKSKTVVFIHPDLGIGGAERLVVDAAVGLQKRGHKVVIFTSHCDPKHCFDEARDGTPDVRVRGNTIVPPTILTRFAILCAILRQLHLIAQIHFSGELAALRPTAVFVDQLSVGLPALRLLRPRLAVFFYCHFPDLLLARGRSRWVKRLYRLPFDALEEWSMGFADAVAVNSNFTKGIVGQTWPGLAAKRELKVVYPCIDTQEKKAKTKESGREDDIKLWTDSKIVLSINRFERKKDVALAIRAFAGLPVERRQGVRLVVAGGYDNRVHENVEYHAELVALADELGLSNVTAKTIVTALNIPATTEVLFFLSVPGALKDALLRSAHLLVYTPANEHFGIVPLEAMLKGVPVLACNTGGPVETVVEGETGWLRPPGEVARWTEVMDLTLHRMSAQDRQRMRQAGMQRVTSRFGESKMAETLDGILDEIQKTAVRRSGSSHLVLLVFVLGMVVLLGAMVATLSLR